MKIKVNLSLEPEELEALQELLDSKVKSRKKAWGKIAKKVSRTLDRSFYKRMDWEMRRINV